MKELQEILKKIADFAPNEKAILATVVDVQGSGYRRAGARMLIDKNGESIGTVSGGCLEADVLERAKKVLETGEAAIITYDTTANENSVFGLGMGCRGIVRVLLELIEKDSELVKIFQSAIENRERQFVATLISTDSDLPVGSKIFYSKSNKFSFVNFLETSKFPQLISDCESFFDENRKPEMKIYEPEKTELLFENINPPLNLLLFGAGYDAIPLAEFAENLGWRVTLVDHRSAWANAERFSTADEIIVSRAENLPENLFADENSVTVVMTHNYEADREILFRLLNSKCAYIGALGPKKRTENLLNELREAGREFDEANLSKLFAPVGLDIGADTPEEIALSIIAEIKTVLAKRNGGFLRERQGGIH